MIDFHSGRYTTERLSVQYCYRIAKNDIGTGLKRTHTAHKKYDCQGKEPRRDLAIDKSQVINQPFGMARNDGCNEETFILSILERV